MAAQITGFPALNDSDLIRDGFIESFLIQSHTDPEEIARLLDRDIRPGVTLIPIRDEEGNVLELRERRKLLPASKIRIEILFSKILEGTGSNPLDPGFAPLPSFGLLGPGLNLLRGGGLTRIGSTEITFQLCDSETIINRKLTVTQEMIDTKTITFNGYPLSFLGIVKEHIEEVDILDDNNEVIGTRTDRFGLNFTQEQIDIIGRFSSGQFEGAPIRSINGATDSLGQFGNTGLAAVQIDDILFPEQENLFENIIRDSRKLKFRGDNPDAEGERAYPYASNSFDDITDKSIKIKTTGLQDGTDLQVGDTIYLTYNIATKRRIRQAFRHRGQGFQDNSVGVPTELGVTLSTSDAFDFQLYTWDVPKVVPDNIIVNLGFKISIDQFIKGYTEPEFLNIFEEKNEKIEGWRLSEAIGEKVENYWTADSRGIVFVEKEVGTVVFERNLIRDQDWFDGYLLDLEAFVIEKKGFYDPDIPFEKIFDPFLDLSGWLFDISNNANSVLFDREKLHYFRLFGQALNKVSEYNNQIASSGIGIVQLDLLLDLSRREGITIQEAIDTFPGSQFLESEFPKGEVLGLMDSSKSEFKSFKGVSLKTSDCEEDFINFPSHYFVDTVNAIDGRGIFLTSTFIENEFQEWRPPGGFLNSQWLLTTPLFCGDFTRKTRVYIERVGGNSLETFSAIYVDTLPSSPSNISLDNSFYADQAIVTFRDDLFHNALAYHRFRDAFVEDGLKKVKQDRTLSHEPIDFDHEDNKVIGTNRILGDIPSYSNGVPITTEFRDICTGKRPGFYQTVDLLDFTTNGFLDFSQNNPILSFPSTWSVKEIIIEYDLVSNVLPEEDKFLSLKFSGSETVINNISFPVYGNKSIIFTLDTKFYNGGPIELISGAWSHINVIKATMKFTEEEIIDIKIDSGQTGTVYDRSGRLLVFYADDASGNISVVISSDEGITWDRYRDILRLIEGEVASLPFVFNYQDSNIIHLFWVLNDSFIMYTEIDTSLFICTDIYIDYKPPTFYDSTSTDDDSDNDGSSLSGFSDSGRKLRRETSYFVAGDAEDPIFQEQLIIAGEIKEKNTANESNNISDGGIKLQTVRFDFWGRQDQMTQDFLGNAYAIFRDNNGIIRLFMLTEGKLTIKSSANFLMWFIDVEDIEIHNNIIGEEEELEIKNIQVIRNPFDYNLITVFYFHNGMLFLRNFQSNLLKTSLVGDEGNKTLDTREMIEHLSITEETGNLPVFLVGTISQTLKDNLLESNLAVRFFYGSRMIDSFDDKFAIDTDTQVVAYVMREGLMRVFYKDNIGSLQSVIVNGLRPTLEVQNKLITN